MKRVVLLIICLFVSLLLLPHNSRSTNLILHTCKKAAKADPNISYKFCVSSLEAYPNSQNSSLEELGAISIELAISNATNTSSCIHKLMEDRNFDPFAKTCLKDCSELYSDAIPTLKGGLRDYRFKDYNKANVEVSSAMDASVTCEDGFKDKKGEVSPLTKENDNLFQLSAIALAFTNMFY